MAPEKVYEDLVLSMLAVNNCSLEKVFRCQEGLQREGFFDAAVVKGWNLEAACRRLKAAGYDRGPYYGEILSHRLLQLAKFVAGGGIQNLHAALEAHDRATVDAALLRVNGIGPAVLRNFWVLQE